MIDGDKFHGKFRITSTRLKTWDYTWPGYYFITVCTRDRQNYFGGIIDEKMKLNPCGEIAKKYWLEIPDHFDNVKIDAFIVMPNHVHGILIIDNVNNDVETLQYIGDNVETLHCNVSTMQRSCDAASPECNVSTGTGAGTPGNTKTDTGFYSGISPKPKSVSTIIRSYKSICTKTINRMPVETFRPTGDNDVETLQCNVSTMQRSCNATSPQCNVSTVFAWQSRFYDHIIRDEKTLERIRNYIINNPSHWEEDEYFG